MFYILFLLLYQIYLIKPSANHYLTKRSQRNKKSHHFRVNLDNFLIFKLPGGGSRGDVSWRFMDEYDIRNLRFWYISPPFPHHMKSENRPFLTVEEVSKLLGISVSTINRLVKRREFPPKRKISPGRMVFMKYQIQEWIDNRRSDW